MAEVEIRSQIKLGMKEILEGISQLEVSDIEVFLKEVSQLLAQKKQKLSPQSTEAQLLKKLEGKYPSALSQRYHVLTAKAEQESLTDQEQEELIRLSDQFEALDAQRLQYLLELAKLRNQTLPLLLKELSLNSPPSANA